MLESFFVQKQVLSRLHSGPIGPYLPDLAAQLMQQHYARRTGCILLHTADRLGRRIVRVTLQGITAPSLQSYCRNLPEHAAEHQGVDRAQQIPVKNSRQAVWFELRKLAEDGGRSIGFGAKLEPRAAGNFHFCL